MNYERGFKRIYAVAAVVWILVFLIGAASIQADSADHERAILGFIATGIAGPIIGYILFFRVLPWIFRGFK